MNPSDTVKFKKGRDAARQALNKAVTDLSTKYELTPYEVFHAIVDKAFVDHESRIENYPSMYSAHISNGLAETYHKHTLALADEAQGKMTAEEAETEPAKPKPSLKELWAAKQKVKAGTFINKPKATLTEYVPLKPTKNTEDWLGSWNQPKVAVGGTIAKTTVEHYGYELPPGYFYKPTPWGGEYTVEKHADLDQHLAQYNAGINVDYCGPKGCIHWFMNPGDYQELTMKWLYGAGLIMSQLKKILPEQLTVEYVANKDVVLVTYPA